MNENENNEATDNGQTTPASPKADTPTLGLWELMRADTSPAEEDTATTHVLSHHRQSAWNH